MTAEREHKAALISKFGQSASDRGRPASLFVRYDTTHCCDIADGGAPMASVDAKAAFQIAKRRLDFLLKASIIVESFHGHT